MIQNNTEKRQAIQEKTQNKKTKTPHTPHTHIAPAFTRLESHPSASHVVK